MAKKGRRTPVSQYGLWAYAKLLEKNMSVKELGERIGIKRQNLSSYLHGQNQNHGYRAKIEKVLGQPPAEISQPDALAS